MRGAYWVASRQREHVTGQRFAPNSLRKAQMILFVRKRRPDSNVLR